MHGCPDAAGAWRDVRFPASRRTTHPSTDERRLTVTLLTYRRLCTSLLTAGLLAGVATSSGSAQSAPPQVVQAGDGTLYVVRGGTAWMLVPNTIGDDELAGLNLTGEI